MKALRLLSSALLLSALSGQVLADAASHAAEAEAFLKLARADKLTVPVYAQVQQMFAQGFAQAKAPESKKAVLERYQAKANAELDKAVGWPVLKPELVKLYTNAFSEQELKELMAFYQSPLGKKVLENMPMLTAESARLTQAKLQSAVPQVNKLVAEMNKELGVK